MKFCLLRDKNHDNSGSNGEFDLVVRTFYVFNTFTEPVDGCFPWNTVAFWDENEQIEDTYGPRTTLLW